MTGYLIAFEGGEGSGKSTQARRLADRLGRAAQLTFEPGDSALGAEVRRLLLDAPELDISARAEALLMAADRAQHVIEVIRPALAAGRVVITDRYAGSSIAFFTASCRIFTCLGSMFLGPASPYGELETMP